MIGNIVVMTVLDSPNGIFNRSAKVSTKMFKEGEKKTHLKPFNIKLM